MPRHLRASRNHPYIILMDLGRECECAPQLVAPWGLPDVPPTNLLLRVAVRAVDAWLPADRESIASFLGVSEDRVPARPE